MTCGKCGGVMAVDDHSEDYHQVGVCQDCGNVYLQVIEPIAGAEDDLIDEPIDIQPLVTIKTQLTVKSINYLEFSRPLDDENEVDDFCAYCGEMDNECTCLWDELVADEQNILNGYQYG